MLKLILGLGGGREARDGLNGRMKIEGTMELPSSTNPFTPLLVSSNAFSSTNRSLLTIFLMNAISFFFLGGRGEAN